VQKTERTDSVELRARTAVGRGMRRHHFAIVDAQAFEGVGVRARHTGSVAEALLGSGRSSAAVVELERSVVGEIDMGFEGAVVAAEAELQYFGRSWQGLMPVALGDLSVKKTIKDLHP
jgi:hypothetical protein